MYIATSRHSAVVTNVCPGSLSHNIFPKLKTLQRNGCARKRRHFCYFVFRLNNLSPLSQSVIVFWIAAVYMCSFATENFLRPLHLRRSQGRRLSLSLVASDAPVRQRHDWHPVISSARRVDADSSLPLERKGNAEKQSVSFDSCL